MIDRQLAVWLRRGVAGVAASRRYAHVFAANFPVAYPNLQGYKEAPLLHPLSPSKVSESGFDAALRYLPSGDTDLELFLEEAPYYVKSSSDRAYAIVFREHVRSVEDLADDLMEIAERAESEDFKNLTGLVVETFATEFFKEVYKMERRKG